MGCVRTFEECKDYPWDGIIWDLERIELDGAKRLNKKFNGIPTAERISGDAGEGKYFVFVYSSGNRYGPVCIPVKAFPTNTGTVKNPFKLGQYATTGNDSLPKDRAGKRGKLSTHPDLDDGWFYISEWDDGYKAIVPYHYVELAPFNNSGIVDCASQKTEVSQCVVLDHCIDCGHSKCQCADRNERSAKIIKIERLCVDCGKPGAQTWHAYGDTLLCSACTRARLAPKQRISRSQVIAVLSAIAAGWSVVRIAHAYGGW